MNILSSLPVFEKHIKRTMTKCPVCRNQVSGEVVERGRQVLMKRTCPAHGYYETLLSSDSRFYWHAQGDPCNSCCGGTCSPIGGGKQGHLGKNAMDEKVTGVIEKLSTCAALIEIVDSCNLTCPTCYATSPWGPKGHTLKASSFEELTKRIQGVIDRKGPIELLQFSGGEPTLHPNFFELVDWVRSHPKIEYLLINTNGVLIATNDSFAEKLGELFRQHDNIQLYLQFDGPQEAGQQFLRGGDLRKMRVAAIEKCAKYDLPITLAMTVNRLNIDHMWDTVEFARPYEHIRGISFQPMFKSGRTPGAVPQGERVTTADVILGLHEQSNEFIRLDDFTPLPCGDPNCATIGWIIRMFEKWFSPTAHGIDVAEMQKTQPDRIRYNLDDLAKCGCEGTPLGELMKKMEAKESNAFRLFIKPFMDEDTWDQDRIDRCCTHVIRPDGALDSFCRYYSNKAEQV